MFNKATGSIGSGPAVARCLDVEVAPDGSTEEAAVEALNEALQLYFDGSELAGRYHLSLGGQNNLVDDDKGFA